jgi:hypothetical protein
VPTVNQRLTTMGWASLGDRLQPNLPESGGYLGIPLVLLLIFFVVRHRQVVAMRFATAMAAAAWLLSLGPRLIVDGHVTVIPLPFDLFVHLPIFNSLLAGRFTLFVDLFVGFVLGIGVDRLHTDLGRVTRKTSEIVNGTFIGLIMLVTLFPLLPRWPYPHVTVDSTTSSFFQSKAVDDIPDGRAVLTYPYPVFPENQAMLWQAVSSMRFRILGGFAFVPGADNSASPGPAAVYPAAVPNTLIADYDGRANLGPAATPTDVRALVARYGISSIVVGNGGAFPGAAIALFTDTYGPPRTVGGVALWSPLP